MVKIYPKDSEMAKQMEEVFKLSTIILKLNELPPEDKAHFRNMIVNSILRGTCKDTMEIIGVLEIWKHEWLCLKV
jgi:hypothetical protein